MYTEDHRNIAPKAHPFSGVQERRQKMRVRYTLEQYMYGTACLALADAYAKALPAVKEMIEREYGSLPDRRTLFVVLRCPCCSECARLECEDARSHGAVLVSPFNGIGSKNLPIESAGCPPYPDPSKYDPFALNNPSKYGAATLDKYLDSVRAAINRAFRAG